MEGSGTESFEQGAQQSADEPQASGDTNVVSEQAVVNSGDGGGDIQNEAATEGADGQDDATS